MRGAFTYSRMVAWLKVALPLAALALLATLFLVPRGLDLSDALPFAKVELEKRLRDQQVTAPYFSGQTSSGDLVAISAETARPDPDDPNRTLARNMGARIDTVGGTRITATANLGIADGEFDEFILQGGVEILTSQGYAIHTDEITISLAETRAESGGEITANGPLGQLQAGRWALRPTGGSDDVYLFFTKGVKLIYTPKETTR